jgi:O-antigen ligase
MASAGISTTPLTAGRISPVGAAVGRYENAMLAAFFFCLYTRDWLYPAAFKSTFILYLGYAGVIVCLVLPVGFLAMGDYGRLLARSKAVLNGIFWATGAVALVVLAEQFAPSAAHETPRPFHVILFLASYLWMLMGFSLADRAERAHRLLSRTAFYLAILCVIAAFLRATGIELTLYCSFPGWQTRLVFLFPYAWYLTRWLLNRTDHDALAGLGASSLEIWGSLHKPFLFSAAIASLFILWSATRFGFRAMARVAGIGAAAVAGVWVVDATITHGALFSEVRTFVFEKAFHEDRGGDLNKDWDELLAQFTGGRLELWELAAERFQVSPWIGSGFEQTFLTSIPDEDCDEQNVEVGVLCHNGYLDLLLSVGILGFLPLAAVVAWGMWRMRATIGDPVIQRIQIAVCGYLVAIAAFNLGGTSRVFIAGSLLPAFVFGIGLRLSADRGAVADPCPVGASRG